MARSNQRKRRVQRRKARWKNHQIHKTNCLNNNEKEIPHESNQKAQSAAESLCSFEFSGKNIPTSGSWFNTKSNTKPPKDLDAGVQKPLGSNYNSFFTTKITKSLTRNGVVGQGLCGWMSIIAALLTHDETQSKVIEYFQMDAARFATVQRLEDIKEQRNVIFKCRQNFADKVTVQDFVKFSNQFQDPTAMKQHILANAKGHMEESILAVVAYMLDINIIVFTFNDYCYTDDIKNSFSNCRCLPSKSAVAEHSIMLHYRSTRLGGHYEFISRGGNCVFPPNSDILRNLNSKLKIDL